MTSNCSSRKGPSQGMGQIVRACSEFESVVFECSQAGQHREPLPSMRQTRCLRRLGAPSALQCNSQIQVQATLGCLCGGLWAVLNTMRFNEGKASNIGFTWQTRGFTNVTSQTVCLFVKLQGPSNAKAQPLSHGLQAVSLLNKGRIGTRLSTGPYSVT